MDEKEPSKEEIYTVVFIAASLFAGQSFLRDENLVKNARRLAKQVLKDTPPEDN